MAARKLRVATTADSPSPPKSVTEAASGGTHRELLVAMRDRVAKAVASPECPPRDLSSLTRRLMEIAKEIAVIDLSDEQEARSGANTPDEAFDAAAL